MSIGLLGDGMTFSLLSPAFATSYFNGFRTSPFAGEMAVSFADGSCRSIALNSETLGPSNAVPFVETAYRLIEAFPRERTFPFLLTDGDGCRWRSSGTPKRPSVEGHSAADGRHVEIIRMQVSGINDKSIRLYVGFKGRFSEARIRQSVTVDDRSHHLVTVHELKLQGPMLRGLRRMLDMSPSESMEGLVLGLSRSMGLEEVDTDAVINFREGPEGRREWSQVRSSSSLRHNVFIWGEEDLSIFFHVPSDDTALDPRVKDLWNLAASEAAHHKIVVGAGG
jgi:hypothetical protein